MNFSWPVFFFGTVKPTTEQNMISLEWFSVAGFSGPGPGAQFGEDVDKVPVFQRSGARKDGSLRAVGSKKKLLIQGSPRDWQFLRM